MRDSLATANNLNWPSKRLRLALLDAALIVSCFVVAMALRAESLAFAAMPGVWLVPTATLPVTLLLFSRLGLYRGVFHFVTSQAVVALAAGVLASALWMFVVTALVGAPVPHSVPAIYAMLLFLCVGGSRLVPPDLFRKTAWQQREPVLIYGAGAAGRQLADALRHGRDYAPVAFLDDDPGLQGSIIAGRRVYAPAQAQRLMRELRVRGVLLAIPRVSRARRRGIVASLEPLGLEVKTIPGMADAVGGVVGGQAKFPDLRNVTPEDLLGRDPVPPRLDLMSRNIRGKVVLVTGAGGSIGSELCRQIILHEPAALVLFEVSEFALYNVNAELRDRLAAEGKSLRIEPILGSIQNPDRVRAVLRVFGVQTVYHAAAYKHVVMVEENVVEGIHNNVFGTRVLVEAAAALGVENFIMISTDKAVRPTNFMGASKRMAELVCQAEAQKPCKTTFSMVRFGNVLGTSGSVIPRFRKQIETGGPVTVTHREITRYFMTIREAAQLVIQAGAMARGGDVFVLDMGDPVKIIDLAQTMVRLHGLKPYVLDENGNAEGETGDIAIRIVGLNKGEKLYEELLIGDNPQGTEHPRVMTATEVSLKPEELDAYLERIFAACQAFDVLALRDILLEAPLAFMPGSDESHDLMWTAARGAKPGDAEVSRYLNAVK